MRSTAIAIAICALASLSIREVRADSRSYLRSSATEAAQPPTSAARSGGPSPSAALTWFDNKADFEAAAGALICVEDFEESTLPPGRIVQFVDELTSDVPCQPQGNCPFPNGLEGCDDMVYQSNGLGGAPNVPDPAPGGFVLDALSVGFGGVTSDVIIMDRFPMSVDVLIRRDDVFAFGATPVTLQGGQTIEVRVYDVDNTFLGMHTVPVNPGGSFFFGVISNDAAIGRVNGFDPVGGNNGAEGLDNIQIHEAGGNESTCVYRDRKVKARRGCRTCAPPGDECVQPSEQTCQSLEDCTKRVRVVMECPGGDGRCIAKRKRCDCQ